jgi:hypothetical protein
MNCGGASEEGIWAMGGYRGLLTALVIPAHAINRWFNRVGMSVVEARDYVMWPKHIHGNPPLRDELLSLEAGALVALEVDGVKGTWVKMEDGKDGTPTPGLKALGAARTHWHGLFKTKRGAVVTITKLAQPDKARGHGPSPPPFSP